LIEIELDWHVFPDSTNVKQIAFHSSRGSSVGSLYVEFTRSDKAERKVYRSDNVSTYLYRSFRLSPSPGRFFADQIRNQYPEGAILTGEELPNE
jgi:hypothetical protein